MTASPLPDQQAAPNRLSPFADRPLGSVSTMLPVSIGVIAVVVPARNEQRRLPRCLAALTAAEVALEAQLRNPPAVRIVVVDDGSSDDTVAIAECWGGIDVVRIAVGRVGAARHIGAAAVLDALTLSGEPAGRLWIASTDADSAVPPDWLLTHLHYARAGVDLLLGTVRPDPAELSGGVLAAWRLRHLMTDGHPHVHGANLGVRGDSYLLAGGFPDVEAHEDVLLRNAVQACGGLTVSTGASPVLTSGRQRGRAPAGLSHYLRDLAAGVHAGVTE